MRTNAFNAHAFALQTIRAAKSGIASAHAALALPIADFTALAAAYTSIANKTREGYRDVRRALAQQCLALRAGCQSHADIADSAKGQWYAHQIRAEKPGQRFGALKYIVVPYVESAERRASASKASKASKPAQGTERIASLEQSLSRAAEKVNATKAENETLRAMVDALKRQLAAKTAECDKLRALVATLQAAPKAKAKAKAMVA